MATICQTQRRLWLTVIRSSHPCWYPGPLSHPTRHQTRPFSRVNPLSLPGSGFSISFPLEFDEPPKIPTSKPKSSGRPRKPKSKAGSKAKQAADPEQVQQPSTKTSSRPKLRKEQADNDGPSEIAVEPTEIQQVQRYSGSKTSTRKAREASEDDIGLDEILERQPLDTAEAHRTRKPGRPRNTPSKGNTATTLQRQTPRPAPKKEDWQIQKAALADKFGDTGWNPRKKLSPDTIEGIRALHAQYPDKYTTPVLADEFKVSAEAVRRILRTKWKPATEAEMEERRKRWARRHDRIWDQQAALGLRPARTKEREVERPEEFEEALRARQVLGTSRVELRQ